MTIKLCPITLIKDYVEILYELLCERETKVNISHKRLPSFKNHKKFVLSRPYKDWRFVMVRDEVVGSIYLTKHNEIGIFIFKAYQSNGCGRMAVEKFMKMKKVDRFLANINPLNNRSIMMFEKLGFKHIQNTYERVI